MTDLIDKNLMLAESTEPSVPSTDPAYLAWKETKIRAALAQSQDRSLMIPADKVWEKLGLER